jgi:hypothetical protein
MSSKIIEISKIIFHNRFLIFIITLEFKYILMFGDKNITDYLDNLALYFNEIILEPGGEL